MSQTTPDPVEGRDDPFRSDDDAREESRPDDDTGVRLPFVVGDADTNPDRDEPGDRV